MPGQTVISGNTLTAGIRNKFINNFRSHYPGIIAKLSPVMELDVPSDKRQEIYSYYNSAPHPRLWKRGNTISQNAFDSATFTVENFNWGLRIPWHRDDREDDQLRDLFTQAEQGGRNFAFLDERIFFQIMTGATDNDLLEGILTAPDGAALYATTAGGSNRFGVSSGNLLSGNGVATAMAIRTDFFNAIEQFGLFQEPNGQPLLSDEVLDGDVTIFFGTANSEVFREAFVQKGVQINLSNTGAKVDSSVILAPPVTNIILDSGMRVKLVPTQRITDNDWFVFLNNSPAKAMFSQLREGMKEASANADNSDQSRDTDEEYVQWRSRKGYGVNIPYGTLKVDN